MKPCKIDHAQEMLLALQDEIRRTEEARYDHRLHGVLLVAQGMTAPEVAQLMGDGKRTVEYWVERFNQDGLAGLTEGDRPGRPQRLDADQLDQVAKVLRASPRNLGLNANLWDGKTLAQWLKQEFGVILSVRQCQRLFRQLGFRLRKPRPMIAQADPVLQRAHKKTPLAGKKRRGGPLGTG